MAELFILMSENRHKLSEFQALLGLLGRVMSPSEAGLKPDFPPENGLHFRDNALGKTLAGVTGLKEGVTLLGEDSGLCCAGLNGAPGLHSARFGGPGSQDGDRRKFLLQSLLGKPRGAFFVTELSVWTPKGEILFFEGRVDGHILDEERGEAGFGYDPLFCPAGFKVSFAQMEWDEKNRISHRGRAVEGFKQFKKGLGQK